MNAMSDSFLKHEVVGGLVASSVLVDLTISVWVGRKTDKKNTRKVVQDNGAQSSNAAHVTKKLFVDNPLLEKIMQAATATRAYVSSTTLPWMGDLKLLPMASFLKFQSDMEALRDEFYLAVDNFMKDYDIQVTAMAFKLGALFDKAEYPSAAELRSKFNMEWHISPLPSSGDFRVDAEQALRDALQEAYQEDMQRRIESSMNMMWAKLKITLEHMLDRLGMSEDGRPNVFRDSMLENAKELVNFLGDLNITKDPAMEQARQKLHKIIDSVDAGELRTNMAIRADVRQNVADILDKFNF